MEIRIANPTDKHAIQQCMDDLASGMVPVTVELWKPLEAHNKN